MALETLKDVTVIDNFEVRKLHHAHMSHWGKSNTQWVEINDDENTILFKIQDGPIKENGVNGCQVDTIIATALLMIQGLDKKFPCDENKEAIDGLKHAWESLKARKANREARGVEGTSQA